MSIAIALSVLLAPPATPPAAAAAGQQEGILRSDSRSPYVHRINLYDATGKVILPRDPLAEPYSPRATCGKCHDYVTISGGWHFNAGTAGVDAGRCGEPWIWTDPRTGTQLPLSDRGWPGTYRPADVGLSDWDIVTAFGRHLPGFARLGPGGPGENEGRWPISGPLEIDCLVCHSADTRHAAAEAALQIERQNFRWIPTVAAGLGVVRGEARTVPDDWDPLAPPDPDHPERAGPRMVYDAAQFDPDGRVFLDITRRPPDQRCYFCHTVHEVGPSSPEAWQGDRDVHLAAGLGCTDCHRHGIDHAMTRGFEGESPSAAESIAVSDASGRPTRRSAATAPPTTGAPLTCRGCHLGEKGAEVGGTATGDSEVGTDGRLGGRPLPRGGRFGAPRPLHAGLPALHLERLTCTACHAGPWPTGHAGRIQTSMAHGLGVASKERTDATPPEILAPVFVRQPDGRIGPARMIWPAFWGRMRGTRIVPLAVKDVERLLAVVLRAPLTPSVSERIVAEPSDTEEPPRTESSLLAEEIGVVPTTPNPPRRSFDKPGDADEPPRTMSPLSAEQIGLALETMAATLIQDSTVEEPVYVRNGRVYRRGADGRVTTFEHPAAAPYCWPLAHDVRPAAQSLGSGGCTDCHAADAAFSFGTVAPETGTQTERAPAGFMYELQGQSPALLRAWAWSFGFRVAFQVVGFGCVAVLGVVLVAYGGPGLVCVIRSCGKRAECSPRSRPSA